VFILQIKEVVMVFRALFAFILILSFGPRVFASQVPHFVFVAGYNSEKIPGYMTENMRVLIENQEPYVDQIRPPSETSVTNNIQLVKRRLLDLYKQGQQRPLIVIAHSKGGLETINTLLRNASDFPPSVVERVYLVQSPVGGSPYTDRVMAKWDESIFSWNPLYWALRSQHAGFLSMLSPQVHRDLAESAKSSTAEQLASLSARTFLIRSSKPLETVSKSLRESAEAIRDLGPNDGLVPTDRMLFSQESGLKGFGTDLGVRDDIDHLDHFVLGDPPSQKRAEQIRDFTHFVLTHSQDKHGMRAACIGAF
jgi:hypothetical protein